MSKSLNNYIGVSDDPDTVREGSPFITDPEKVRRGDPGRPEICPIFALHGHFSPEDVGRIEATCRTGELGCVDCKTLLADPPDRASLHLLPRAPGRAGRSPRVR